MHLDRRRRCARGGRGQCRGDRTRHDSHARYACAALAPASSFVEKPLASSSAELVEVASAYAAARAQAGILMVGFNRRFAPLAVELRKRLARLPGPRCLVYTINAGALPPGHWTQEPLTGGGRLVGEACHFIDLLRYLVAQPI